ncbi:hypothetical protein TcWFU_006819 [Taenia crassiceps]|uniref:Uncharacterized protein n=1 Tax=Taenia crassiceps TaxID=6207 RepID=A0ABR4QBF3_9CEST
MEGVKHFPEKSILRKPLGLNHDQTTSPKAVRKLSQKPCFEGRIKTTFIVDEADPFLSPTEVIEPLQEDDSDRRGSPDSQSRRKQWLRQAISVDGERVPAKLLHQFSLDHGYIRNSSTDNDSSNQDEASGDSTENDLDDLQSQRALVEAELRRQAKAPPGLKIRDLLACRSIIEDEDDDDEEGGGKEAEGDDAKPTSQEKEEVSKANSLGGKEGLDESSAQVKMP